MALSVPLSLLQFPGYFTDLDGDPLASGWLTFYAAGTTDLQDIFGDCNGDSNLVNPFQLDSSGFGQVFLGSAGLYDVVVSAFEVTTPTVPGAELYTVEGVGNPGQILFAGLGNVLAEGSKNVDSGYAVLSTDNLVTVTNVSNTDPWIVQLPAAATRSTTGNGSGMPLVIKNLSAKAGHIVAAGADTVDNSAAYVIPAAASPLYPSVILYSDADSVWWVAAGVGIT
jgi:hypothetical protein